MYLIGLGTSVPAKRYTQTQCWEALSATEVFGRLSTRSKAVLKKVLNNANGPIANRHLALSSLSEVGSFDPDSLHARFAEHAPALASQAAERALSDAGVTAETVDAVIVSTCTGYLCPGLSSYLIEQLVLRPDVHALDLVGHGCGAALPNLETARGLLASQGAQVVLSVCVEVSSAAFYLDDDPGTLISACLFGDGAAAVVAGADPKAQGRQLAWKDFASLIEPDKRELLRFEQRRGMLRNVLTPVVPQMAAEYGARALARLLADGMPRSTIRTWIFHPGGRDVLDGLGAELDLSSQDLSWSRGVLREFGNQSSAGVLFALKAARDGGAAPGLWFMSSFGAGFSCYGALLEASA